MTIEFGLLLPHFSSQSSWEKLFGFADRVEQLPYASVWARDNLGYHGHGFELPGNQFVDPFTTLAGIGARTTKLKLGTAVLTPFRHPLETAQLLGGIDFLSRGRLELGIGPGTPRKPWEALGKTYEDRVTLCRETVEVMRLVAAGPNASYDGEITKFEDVTIEPAPRPDTVVWYGGASNASIRAIVQYADGMLPGRCPFTRYDVAAERLKGAMEEAGRGGQERLGSIPIVTIGKTREEALGKIDVAALLQTATERWKRPFDKPEDLAGALIAGTADDCIEQVQTFVDRGVELLIVDLRLLMSEFEEATEAFVEVINAFQPATEAAPA